MTNKRVFLFVALSIIIGFLVRFIFIYQMPVGNDEAFYLYDAYNINHGQIPYKDFLTKGVPYIYLLSLWQRIFGQDLILNRILTVILSLIVGYVSYKTLRRLTLSASLMAITSILFDPFIASRSIFAATNIPFILGYLLVFFFYFSSVEKFSWFNILLTATFFCLTYFIRQTAAFILPVLIFHGMIEYLNIRRDERQYKQILTPMLIVGFFFIEVFFVYYLVNYLYGFKVANELLALSVTKLGSTIAQAQSISRLQYIFIRFEEIFFSFINLSFISPHLILVLITSASFFIIIFFKKYGGLIITVLITITGLVYCATIYKERLTFLRLDYPNGLYFSYLANLLALTIGSLSSIILINKLKLTDQMKALKYFITFVVALVCLLGVYSLNIKFDYSLEYYPLLFLIGSITVSQMFTQPKAWLFKGLFIFSIIYLMAYSYLYNYQNPNTGSHKIVDFYETTTTIKANTTNEDTVFTGFPAFAWQAGREVPLNISHPAWYGYTFINLKYRNQFLPRISDLKKEIINNPPKYAVIDKFTKNSYLDRYPKIRNFINENYVVTKKYSTFVVYSYKSR